MISFMGNLDGLFPNKKIFDDCKILAKIVLCPENRLIKNIYNMLLKDIELMPHKSGQN